MSATCPNFLVAQPLYPRAFRLDWSAIPDLSHTLLMHNQQKFTNVNIEAIWYLYREINF
ncbi:hypothetical protein [Dapis sp. BLCC M172]|uniref:hypothetical protein n=1 Tax=Dapis sp. BLCC M172 TaxID=2975281 RepID=UPI003CF38319